MRRAVRALAFGVVVVLVGAGWTSGGAAQEEAEPTIAAYSTRVAELEATVSALEAVVAETPVSEDGGRATALLVSLAASDVSDVELPAGLDGAEATVAPYDPGDSDVAGAVGGVAFGWESAGLGLSYYVYPSVDTAEESFAGRAKELADEIVEETTVANLPAFVLTDDEGSVAVLVLVDQVIVAAVSFVDEDGSPPAAPDVVIALAEAGVAHLAEVRRPG